jgi:hypothetical protein
MNLNAYLRALIANSNSLYTPGELKVSSQLCQVFTNLLTTSDQQVREYGRSLYWQGAAGAEKLVVSAANFIGGANGSAVDLQTQNERQRADYIGGFHTHPYALKYGQGIGVGPSNADWLEWWLRPPTGRTVAAHFVASGGELFLIIFRGAPVGPLAQNNITSDTARLNDAVRTWSDDDQLHYGEHLQAQRWVQSRQLLLANSPSAIGYHQADAHKMNCDLAKANGVEYFKSNLNNGASTLSLASDRVLGNWFTANLWTRSTDSWLN